MKVITKVINIFGVMLFWTVKFQIWLAIPTALLLDSVTKLLISLEDKSNVNK